MGSLVAAAFIGFLLPGVGPHSCVQFTDTGRVELHAEGLPDPGISGWLSGPQTTPMPQDLAEALPQIQPCLPGKHHA